MKIYVTLLFIVLFLSSCTLPWIQSRKAPNDIFDQLSVPDGYSIELFAKVPNARSLAIDESNGLVVFVGTRKKSVYAVYDKDGDYTADEIKIIANNLTQPNGVALKNGDLYVAEISQINKFPSILDNGDKPTSSVIYNQFPNDGHHGWKYIAFGPDGLLYIPVGAPCNVCEVKDPYSSLFAFNVTSGQINIIARGIRNTVGFDWDENGQLWFTDNGRDLMGDDIPPDELNMISSMNQHFGFPNCHGKNIEDPEFGDDCTQYSPPIVELGPHVAALGMNVVKKGPLAGKILIAEHGSWNRRDPIGYRISIVDPVAKSYDVFIDGWLDDGVVYGRPVDIVQLKDESFLISDDHSGLIYRVFRT